MATGSLFLGLAGVSFTVATARARARGLSGRCSCSSGAAADLAAGLAVSFVTWILLGDGYVRFGILHLIAVGLFLAPFAARLGAWNLLVAGALVVAGRWTEGLSSDLPGLLPLGVRPEESRVGVTGTHSSRGSRPSSSGSGPERASILAASGEFSSLPAPRPACVPRLAGAPGRHSLAIYLGHQAVLPLVAAVLLAAGVEMVVIL